MKRPYILDINQRYLPIIQESTSIEGPDEGQLEPDPRPSHNI